MHVNVLRRNHFTGLGTISPQRQASDSKAYMGPSYVVNSSDEHVRFTTQDGFDFIGRKDFDVMSFRMRPMEALTFKAYQKMFTPCSCCIATIRASFSGISRLTTSSWTVHRPTSSYAMVKMKLPVGLHAKRPAYIETKRAMTSSIMHLQDGCKTWKGPFGPASVHVLQHLSIPIQFWGWASWQKVHLA